MIRIQTPFQFCSLGSHVKEQTKQLLKLLFPELTIALSFYGRAVGEDIVFRNMVF